MVESCVTRVTVSLQLPLFLSFLPFKVREEKEFGTRTWLSHRALAEHSRGPGFPPVHTTLNQITGETS